jgi:ribosomal protein S27AE
VKPAKVKEVSPAEVHVKVSVEGHPAQGRRFCPKCGNTGGGAYCPECGEKTVAAKGKDETSEEDQDD